MASYYSATEAQIQTLNVLAAAEAYYLNAPGLTLTQRVHGAMGAVLAAFEGENPDLPVYIVAPSPDPDYAIQNLQAGNDYFEPSALAYGTNISDGMFERWNS